MWNLSQETGMMVVKFFRLLGRIAAKYWYAVILLWVAVTVFLLFYAPSLSDLASSDQGDFLPKDSPSVKARQVVDRYFPSEGGYKSTVIVTVEKKEKLTEDDFRQVQKFAAKIKECRYRDNIVKVINAVDNPEAKEYLNSQDGKSTLIVVGLKSNAHSPATFNTVAEIEKLKKEMPSTLELHVTGDTVIMRDYNNVSMESVHRTTIVTVVLVVIILLVVYRAPVAAAIPLVSIAISFLISRSVVALLAQAGLKISSITEIFLVVMLFGAGTDYCLFLLSRYREELGKGYSIPEAIEEAVATVGEALASSAATVIVGTGFMGFARFGVFNTTGPSVAIGVFISLLASLTLTPAFIRICGPIVFWPRKQLAGTATGNIWEAISRRVETRPGLFFLVTTAFLGVVALASLNVDKSYDLFRELPAKSEAVQGYQVFKRHYQQGRMLPLTVVVEAKDKLNTPDGMNLIYHLTREIESSPRVDGVESAAQPGGRKKEMEKFLIQGQVGIMAEEMQKGAAGARELARGLSEMEKAFASMETGLRQARNTLAEGQVGKQKMRDGAYQVYSGLRQSEEGAKALSAGLGQMATSTGTAINGLNTIAGTLQEGEKLSNVLLQIHPELANDPYYQSLMQIISGSAAGVKQSSAGLTQLQSSLQTAGNEAAKLAGGLGALAEGQQKIAAGLDQELKATASYWGDLEKMIAGSSRLKEGLRGATSGASRLAEGYDKAGGFLKEISQQAGNKDGYFYIPQEAYERYPELKKAVASYFDREGKRTKLVVILKDEPYSAEAMAAVDEVKSRAESFLRERGYKDAKVYVTGTSAFINDMSHIIDEDFILLVALVTGGVYVILVLLLRSLFTPIYLVLTILLSYAGTLGITVLLFNYLLGYPGLDWKVQFFMFVLLVALGEDYNILIMSRIKEETAAYGVREGVRRAVAMTGSIITSAGIIMAGTFAALMTSPLISMVELGFAVALGVLIDTFVVRPLLVPAIVLLLDRIKTALVKNA